MNLEYIHIIKCTQSIDPVTGNKVSMKIQKIGSVQIRAKLEINSKIRKHCELKKMKITHLKMCGVQLKSYCFNLYGFNYIYLFFCI